MSLTTINQAYERLALNANFRLAVLSFINYVHLLATTEHEYSSSEFSSFCRHTFSEWFDVNRRYEDTATYHYPAFCEMMDTMVVKLYAALYPMIASLGPHSQLIGFQIRYRQHKPHDVLIAFRMP